MHLNHLCIPLKHLVTCLVAQIPFTPLDSHTHRKAKGRARGLFTILVSKLHGMSWSVPDSPTSNLTATRIPSPSSATQSLADEPLRRISWFFFVLHRPKIKSLKFSHFFWFFSTAKLSLNNLRQAQSLSLCNFFSIELLEHVQMRFNKPI